MSGSNSGATPADVQAYGDSFANSSLAGTSQPGVAATSVSAPQSSVDALRSSLPNGPNTGSVSSWWDNLTDQQKQQMLAGVGQLGQQVSRASQSTQPTQAAAPMRSAGQGGGFTPIQAQSTSITGDYLRRLTGG